MTGLPNFAERLKSGASFYGTGYGNVGAKGTSNTVADPGQSRSNASFSAMSTDHASGFKGGLDAFGWSKMPIDPSYAESSMEFEGRDKVALDASTSSYGLPGIKAGSSNSVDVLSGPGGKFSVGGSSSSGNWL